MFKATKEMKALFDCDNVGELKEYVGCKVENSGKRIKLTQPVLMQSYEDEFDLPKKNQKLQQNQERFWQYQRMAKNLLQKNNQDIDLELESFYI